MNTTEVRNAYGYPVGPLVPLPEVSELQPHAWWVETYNPSMGWTPVFYGTVEQAERHKQIILNRGAWRDKPPRLTPCY